MQQINDLFAEAIEKAGPILAITAAGGTFGAVIKATGFGDQVSELAFSSKVNKKCWDAALSIYAHRSIAYF